MVDEEIMKFRRAGMESMLSTLSAYADANERALIVIYPQGGWSIANYETMEREADRRAIARLEARQRESAQ